MPAGRGARRPLLPVPGAASRSRPRAATHVYELTTGSAGGHVSTQPNPGVLRAPARFAILTYAPAHGHLRYAVVTVRPDASVTVTRPVGLPYGVLGGLRAQ